MIKKLAALCLAIGFVLPTFNLFAKDVTEKSVGAENSWQESIPLEDKKAGKYNIVVTASDIAGNQGVAGPFNIWIDPESDLPVAGITNPAPNMYIPGNLNIVGTCIDDDGVKYVTIILDGDTEHAVRANGAEFWSYYLDTTGLTEGAHTISVYGTDINGLDGNVVSLTWNLNRHNPETVVNNPGVGDLVSGKFNLQGYVKDGNGIKSLEYSLDGGVHYEPVSIKAVKLDTPDDDGCTVHYSYSVPIDTKKYPDGPGICWFKGIDNAGTIGYFAFLYFIDNTAPDIKILSPEDKEVMNGVFSISGYAKDTNGMVSLSWQWGNETGDFNLIAGNPYWTKEVSAIGVSGKSQKFIVTGVDVMGNVVTVTRDIPLDPEADKPVVTISNPMNGLEIEGKEGSLFLRGIVTDDDGIAKVFYRVDGGEYNSMDCEGVFYTDIPGTFSIGNHTITVYAEDKYGVKGNPVTHTFVSNGLAPEFKTPTLKTSKGSVVFENGMSINPESNPSLEVPVFSSIGLASVDYEIKWGTNGRIANEVALKGGDKTASVNIPLIGDDFPWGILTLTVKAKDTFGRETNYNAFLNIRNLNHGDYTNPGVYFTDSSVSEDGTIHYVEGRNVSGYFLGATARSVSVVPEVRGVKASLKGNSIILTSNGNSGNFVVRVTTASGATYSSKEMHFVANPSPATLTIDNDSVETGVPVDFATQNSLTVSGRVSSDSDATLKYRVLAVQATLVDGVVKSSQAVPVPSVDEAVPVELNSKGSFSVTFKPTDFVDGVSVIEFIAENASGKQTAKAVVVNNVPAKRIKMDDTEVIPPSDVPRVYWLHGVDWYGVCLYQGNVDKSFTYIKTDSLRADAGKITFTVSPTDVDKPATYTATANAAKAGTISSYFHSVDGVDYASGMNIVMKQGTVKDEGHSATVFIDSTAAIVSADWSITGPDTVGGDISQKGKAVPITIEEAKKYKIEIPLANLPARATTIQVTVTDATGATETIRGTINVVRNHSVVNEAETVYLLPFGKTVYDSAKSRYVFEEGSGILAFVNSPSNVKGSVVGGGSDLSASTQGKVVSVLAEKDNVYSGIIIRGTDDAGGTLTSSAIEILSDTKAPSISLTSPSNNAWVGNSVYVAGTVSDNSGIRSLAWSIFDESPANVDGTKAEEKWNNVQLGKGGAFEFRATLSDFADGEIPFNIRAIDITGKEFIKRLVLFKDTTPPEVKVIVPEEGALVNGENLIVFNVKDNGVVTNINYTSSGKGIVHNYDAQKNIESEGATGKSLREASPNAFVGTEELPINDKMNWSFKDKSGNTTTLSSYGFKVNAESDLPVSEIHMPEENSVITTDFTVSGIIYDDDGSCRLYFKMDNGKYNLISEEYSSSYKINIPLSAMTDNEHTITVMAEDIHGTKGPEVSRKFRVSLEEPKGSVTSPAFDETVKGSVTIRGNASDKNGIAKVMVSLDNGATYNEAVGTDNWSYTFDTHVIQDGTHVVFVKIYDNYGITGLYSSLINIDNTAPELSLELPLDDSTITKTVFFSGQTTDNIGLTSLYITIRSFTPGVTIPASLARINLTPDEIITNQIDLSGLQNGFYNIELTGTDAANNITRVSRNIQLNKDTPRTKVGILYPLNGEHVQSVFNIYGTASSEEEIEKVELLVDGKSVLGVGPSVVTDGGFFKFNVHGEVNLPEERAKDEEGNVVVIPGETFELKEGQHKYRVVCTTKSGAKINSVEQTFIYSKYGPWVTLDNFSYGDFATERPLLKGNAGYVVSPEEKEALKNKDLASETKAAIQGKRVKQVSVSFDNGKTYTPVSKKGKGNWEYRVEDEDIAAGTHFMLVKAEMENGENVTTRVIIQIDHEKPTIKLISPGEGGRYNQSLQFDGLSSDDVGLKDVTVALRKGDKSSYELPSFIQGLYFDSNVWGASLWSVGVGLTAFDNAVKVQMQYGQFTEEQWYKVNALLGNESTSSFRFGGQIIGVKIIAQLGYIPFRYFWGRDFDWLSASISVGANFSWFSESGANVAQMLSAALVQVEFPRITFAKAKLFKTWAFYVEPQVWLIPSDVTSDDVRNYVFTCSFGIRTSVF